MNKLRLLELFGGIGACSKALKRLGIDYEIADYVEIDKYAVASYNAIHNTNFEPQDITTWDKDIEVDMIMHGSPCQDFSLAGKQAGGDIGSGTRSSLMYETIRIVEKLRPKYVVWENVKNLLSKKHIHNFEAYLKTMESLGYVNYYQVLNAKDYGIPQNRERVFTISIRKDIEKEFVFPLKQELKLKLKDMLEEEVDEKYYLSDKQLTYILDGNDVALKSGRNINDRIINPQITKTISCRGAADQRADVTNFVIDNEENEITVKEAKLRIKNATKQGYLEATDGDSVNLAYPESETRRGRVGKEFSQTLQCNDSMGVVVKEESVYSQKEKELFTENGNIKRYINSDIIDEFKEGQMATTSFPNGYGHGPRTHDESICLNCIDKTSVKVNLRIRKLTPKECYRLMGFDDSDFDKASKVNSNTQLYKQAGNSIVVNVLEAIFKELFKNE